MKTLQKLIIYDPSIYCADFDDKLLDAFPLNKPLISSRHRELFLYGCYNGLILLVTVLYYHQGCQTIDLTVWNPVSKRYTKLPNCAVQTPPKHGAFMSCGLGYDSAYDDYKIVVVSKVHDSNRVFSQVWVFGLKSDIWRRSRDLEDEVSTWVGRFASGALYWACENKCVGFDLAREMFFYIPLLSDYDLPTDFFYESLVVLGGNLYLYRTSMQYYRTVEYHLLVSDVNDKGEVVGVSWRKEFSLENLEMISYDTYPRWPLAYSKDGDSILFRGLKGSSGITLKTEQNKG